MPINFVQEEIMIITVWTDLLCGEDLGGLRRLGCEVGCIINDLQHEVINLPRLPLRQH